ncbi:MAG: folate-binding protein YgfZ, partial [Thiohalomonadales bacterium]
CELGQLGLIRISGDDAMTFLQNQLSNDVKEINQEKTHLSAYCSAKGRVLSLFRIIATGKDYLLQLPQERIDNTIKRLSMFVLMSQVKIENVSAEYGRIGVSGPQVAKVLSSLGLNTDLDINQCYTAGDTLIVRLPGSLPRFEIIADTETLRAFWLETQPQLRAVGYMAWLKLDINAGLPNIYESTSDAFVPQMLNLNSLNAISYTKGCYPGQEVVARMHYLGKQKRRMYLGHISSDKAPQPGDNLYAGKANSEQAIGKIVHSSGHSEFGYDTLAVLQIDPAENDTVHIDNAKGSSFIIKELPYIVELEGSKDKQSEGN